MRIPKGKMLGHGVHARGGPWDGKVVLIPNDGTMVFSLGEWKGFYDGMGRWIPVK